MKKYYTSTAVLVFCLARFSAGAQTLFETAEGEGVIQFRQKKISQIKLNLSSTSITYGFYNISGNAASQTPRFLFSTELKLKPNEDGIATLVKTGEFAPGLKLNTSFGFRFRSLFESFFSPLDLYIKPQYSLNGYTIYDTTRKAQGEEMKYKATRSGLDVLIGFNSVLSPGVFNFFIGAEIGVKRGTNADDLEKGSFQKVEAVPGSVTEIILRDVEEVKIGVLERRTTHPLKLDLIMDPGFRFGKGSTVRPAPFGYYRRHLDEKKYRYGMGLCLVSDKDPSRIFTSFGYEFPVAGDGVKAEDRKRDKGVVFVSVGYSIFQ